MLICALIFSLIALAAGIFGFGAASLANASVGQFVFYGAVALLVVSVMGHFMRRV